MQADNLKTQIDRFVAISLLINEELLDADMEGIGELFDQRERSLGQIQACLDSGEKLSLAQKELLAQQDQYTQSLIGRLQHDLRREVERARQERKSRQAYGNSAEAHYELTG